MRKVCVRGKYNYVRLFGQISRGYSKIIPLDCCIMICNKEGLIVKFVGAESFDMNVREGSGVAKEVACYRGNESF